MKTKHEKDLKEPKHYKQPYRSIPAPEEDTMQLKRTPKGGVITLPPDYVHVPGSKL